MIKDELKTLENTDDKTCVSIIIPTHKTIPENEQDPIRLKNAIKEAKKQLESKANGNISALENKLDEIESHLNHRYFLKGLGIFVSDNVAKSVDIPFDVKEKVIVDDSFEVRDLIYSANRQLEYRVLLFQEHDVRLFAGHGHNLKPMNTELFDLEFEVDKQKPEPVNPFKGIDLSELETRYKRDFAKKVGDKLSKHLQKYKLPLFIVSGEKMYGYLKDNLHESVDLAGHITQNLSNASLNEIEEAIKPQIAAYQKSLGDKMIERIEEMRGQKRFTEGLSNCWEAAMTGNCQTLFVEKDYEQDAFVSEDRKQLRYEVDEGKNYSHLQDAVDDLIELVREQNGEIIFVKKDELNISEPIGLILRYER